MRFLAALALALAAAGLTTGSAAGDDFYGSSVARALEIVANSDRTRPDRAQAAAIQAAAVLRAGTRDTQPEILHDLESRPPDLGDAERRLRALADELAAPRSDVDAQQAHDQINRILAEPRYAPLHGPESLTQRIQDWLLQRLADLLYLLLRHAGGGVGLLVAVGIGVLCVALISWLVWELLRRSRRQVEQPAPTPTRSEPRDYFAEADRLGAAGDYRAAVIALAGGVAMALGGDEAWARSPLTVRELFRRAPEPERLRPLLLEFEGTSYGERDPDAERYTAAAAAAARFRSGPARAAA